jgi:processive 1,2-diacylglycerol beta-glucosyltransferase
MKKILIFYGSYGGGHLSAAKSIKQYIDENYTGAETLMVDCIEYINKIVNKVTVAAYNEMAKKAPWAWEKVYSNAEGGVLSKISSGANKLMSLKLYKLFEEFKPDLVITTHPFGSQMSVELKKKGKINCKIATVMTDYAPHNQWLIGSDYIDYFFVAHKSMAEDLEKTGIAKEKIVATGIPLSNKFLKNYNKEETLKMFDLKTGKITVLFFGGGEFGLGKSNLYEMLKSLVESSKDIQIVVVAGKNHKLKEKFEDIVDASGSSDHVKVLEYTDKVPELMSVSDLVITKPGGLTTTESLASGLPIIVINPIPGQEEENAKYLEQKEVAVWIKKDDNVKEVLEKVLGSKETLKKMKINARLAAKRNSTKDICRILLKN